MKPMFKLVATCALALLVLGTSMRGADAYTPPLNKTTCSNDGAQECSVCAKFAPCTNSVDPRCISTDALDCLECEAYSGCAPCTPLWDKGCIARSPFEYDDGEDGKRIQDVRECNLNTSLTTFHPLGDTQRPLEAIAIPMMTQVVGGGGGCAYWHLVGGWAYVDNEYNSTHWVLHSECANKTACEQMNCDEVEYFPRSDTCGMVAKENATCEYDSNAEMSLIIYGDECGAPSCNSSMPCGETCTPGVEPYCVALGVWRNASSCDFTVPQNSNWATNGDWSSAAFETSAIFDGKCRRDGSGRDSWYRGGCFEGSSPKGRGVLGCSDDKCTKNCLVVEAEPNVCFKESWTGGLYLAIIGYEDEQCQEGKWEDFFGVDDADNDDGGKNGTKYGYLLEFEVTSKCDSALFTGDKNNDAWSDAFSMALFDTTKYAAYVDVDVETSKNETTLTVKANTDFAKNEDAAVLFWVAASDAYEEEDVFADAMFTAADKNVAGNLGGNCNVNRFSFSELEVSGESAVAGVSPAILLAVIGVLIAALF